MPTGRRSRQNVPSPAVRDAYKTSYQTAFVPKKTPTRHASPTKAKVTTNSTYTPSPTSMARPASRLREESLPAAPSPPPPIVQPLSPSPSPSPPPLPPLPERSPSLAQRGLGLHVKGFETPQQTPLSVSKPTRKWMGSPYYGATVSPLTGDVMGSFIDPVETSPKKKQLDESADIVPAPESPRAPAHTAMGTPGESFHYGKPAITADFVNKLAQQDRLQKREEVKRSLEFQIEEKRRREQAEARSLTTYTDSERFYMQRTIDDDDRRKAAELAKRQALRTGSREVDAMLVDRDKQKQEARDSALRLAAEESEKNASIMRDERRQAAQKREQLKAMRQLELERVQARKDAEARREAELDEAQIREGERVEQERAAKREKERNRVQSKYEWNIKQKEHVWKDEQAKAKEDEDRFMREQQERAARSAFDEEQRQARVKLNMLEQKATLLDQIQWKSEREEEERRQNKKYDAEIIAADEKEKRRQQDEKARRRTANRAQAEALLQQMKNTSLIF